MCETGTHGLGQSKSEPRMHENDNLTGEVADSPCGQSSSSTSKPPFSAEHLEASTWTSCFRNRFLKPEWHAQADTKITDPNVMTGLAAAPAVQQADEMEAEKEQQQP
eukprot:6374478-Amphidinium_carterae.1